MRLPLLARPNWRLADLPATKVGPSFFSTFAGGGGSSMGYLLAGFQAAGACELDPKMAARYEANLWRGKVAPSGPGLYIGSVRDLIDARPPKELDVLDGSPPCSSFSLAGDRHDSWGKMKKFKEGQAEQVLDRLFFDFIDLAKAWRPRVVVAENVKGMLIGKARGYCLDVMEAFRAAGYTPQLVLLNAARMGVPQARERVFFLASRTDLKLAPLQLDFNEKPISMAQAFKGIAYEGARLSPALESWWKRVPVGVYFHNYHPRGSFFCNIKMRPDYPSPTVTTNREALLLWDKPRTLTDAALVRLQTFPADYDFGPMDPAYILGMSVPPLMVQRVALELRKQWLHE